jgi:hypothetical protein
MPRQSSVTPLSPRGTNHVLRARVMIELKQTRVLVSPTALALSMLHAGGRWPLPIAIARSRHDFMRQALSAEPTVAVVGRGWLDEIELRRLALRRVFSATPRLVLVLRRDEMPTALERKNFDAVFVAGNVFMLSAGKLRQLVSSVAQSASGPTPPRPLKLVA